MSSNVIIHYIGQRKDGNKGAIWGYFTETGKPDKPPYTYRNEPTVYCHVFWGRLGKKLYIECKELTYDFLSEAKSKEKNYRAAESEKIIARWGKEFEEEFSMYILSLKLRG